MLRFSEAGFAYGTEPNDFLAASLQLLPPTGTVLCLGDGEGRNGVFLLEGYTPRQLNHHTGGPPLKDLLMEIDDLQKELQQLHIIHGTEVKREIHEGRLHTGLGAVAQLIARKK
ncbi:MAG: hypothetical protein GQ542_07010 [Desulforhopalus sp.]|nr:hypothetical protein [Desulforhopalus sp.]